MNTWQPQSYKNQGEKNKVSAQVVDAAFQIGNTIRQANPNIEPIFTLGHLAYLTDVPYLALRDIVGRSTESPPYRIFQIKKKGKKSGGRNLRTICVPEPNLLRVQTFIHQNILRHVTPHFASSAYGKNCKITTAASSHSGCKWLLKMDIVNFFETISEISVYKIFRKCGFTALFSFELARICTRTFARSYPISHRWEIIKKREKIKKYITDEQGALPQGAPTSPILSNLAAFEFDVEVEALAKKYGMTYTRYADDVTLSTKNNNFTRETAKKLMREVRNAMRRHGFQANEKKSSIVPPGARRVVLGLLVDSANVKLSKEFKARLKQHIYFCNKVGYGPIKHAHHKKFASVLGFKHHLYGLISYVLQVEPTYGEKIKSEFQSIQWPL